MELNENGAFTIITSDIRLDRRGHAVLVIGDHDLIFLSHGKFKRGNLRDKATGEIVVRGDWDGEHDGLETHGLYQVTILPEYWHPYTYRNTFPGVEKGEAISLDDLRSLAERQAADYAERGWEFIQAGRNRIGAIDYLWAGWTKSGDGGDKPPSAYGTKHERGRLRPDQYRNKMPTKLHKGAPKNGD